MEEICSKDIIYQNKNILIRPRNVHSEYINPIEKHKNLLAERPSITLSKSSRGSSSIKNRVFTSWLRM